MEIKTHAKALLLLVLGAGLGVVGSSFLSGKSGVSKSGAVGGTSAPLPASTALDFFGTLGKLKTLKRTGWVNHGVDMPESVADHMYRMSMMCFMLEDPTINRDKLVKMCLVHDLAEAEVGDITPENVSGVSKEDKRVLEENAYRKIIDFLGETPTNLTATGQELLDLWMEYEERSSLEAIVASQLDKFEMIVQAEEYEIQHKFEKKLQSFFDSTEGYFKHKQIREWDKQLRERRNIAWEKNARMKK